MMMIVTTTNAITITYHNYSRGRTSRLKKSTVKRDPGTQWPTGTPPAWALHGAEVECGQLTNTLAYMQRRLIALQRINAFTYSCVLSSFEDAGGVQKKLDISRCRGKVPPGCVWSCR